jgi:hypothetical protein
MMIYSNNNSDDYKHEGSENNNKIKYRGNLL